MKRRSFLVSLLALPAAAKAMTADSATPAPKASALPSPPETVETPFNDGWELYSDGKMIYGVRGR